MRLLSAVVLSSVFSVVTACNPLCPVAPEPPPIESYDLTCDVDADCVLVSQPNCGPCTCADTPLRRADAGRFTQDQTICCTERVEGVCGACAEGFSACVEGGCIFADCGDDAFAADPRCPQP